MNHTTYIPIEQTHFAQLSRAADYINSMDKRQTVKVTISRIVSDQDPKKPVMVEAKIQFLDLYTLFALGQYFGIIKEKTTPQIL